MVREGQHSWLGSYSAVFVGFVLVFGGFAALGWWLAAVAARAGWQALGTGIAVVLCFGAGFALLSLAGKRRGGLLRWRPTGSEKRKYRAQFRR